MADKGTNGETEGPSLEMPSLGGLLRRRKGQTSDTPAPEEPADVAPEAPSDVAAEVPTAPEPADESPTTILDEPEPPARPLYADEVPPVPPPAPPAPLDNEEAAITAPVAEEAAQEPKAPRGPLLPRLGTRTAAMITGAVVGLLAVGATYLALRACEAVRGVSTCGGGPGVLLLVAILIGLIVFGGRMLRLLGVADPVSTSFLAVGLLAVIVLLFLIDVSFSPWMVLVIPLVCVGTFALSHWVTTSFVDEAD